MADIPILARRFTLEAPTRVSDGGGGHETQWTALGTIWGALRPASAREVEIAGRPASRVTHRLTLRLSLDPSARPRADQRLRLGARIFAIRGVAEDEGGRAFLTVWAEEGAFS